MTSVAESGALKVRILSAALALARVHGFQHVTRELVATRATVSCGAVSYHCGRMEKLRASIVREAVAREDMVILGQAIAARHAAVRDIPDDLRHRVARTLTNTK